MSEAIAAVIGAGIGFIASWLTLRFNYNQLFAQTVSENRMDWINHFREEFSIVLGTASFFSDNQIIDCTISTNSQDKECKNCDKECAKKMILEAERARMKLLTRLNLDTSKIGNEYNEIFERKLKEINFQEGITELQKNQLMELSREILEFEWKKVKQEAKGDER